MQDVPARWHFNRIFVTLWLPFSKFPQSLGDSQECLPCTEGLWPSDGANSLPRTASLTFRKAALAWVAGLHTAGAAPLGLALNNLRTEFPASFPPKPVSSLSPTYHFQISSSPVFRSLPGQCGSQGPLGTLAG